MNFLFKIGIGSFSKKYNDLSFREEKDHQFYFRGLSETEIASIILAYGNGYLNTCLNKINSNNFILFIYDKITGRFIGVNDKFGNNEIFVYFEGAAIVLTNDLNHNGNKEINYDTAYQFLAFHTIAAPKTIYRNIESVPTANIVDVDINNKKYFFERYWKIESLFEPKATSYEDHIFHIREVFYNNLSHEFTENSAVTLSGGIDSGGILGMLTDYRKNSVLSISFGPQGTNSHDLLSARKTVAYNKSINTEIYPSNQMFENLIEMSGSLNQPVAGDFTFANSEMMRVAKQKNIKKLFYGYGTQMLLGNLGLNKLWHRERIIEKILPRNAIDVLYSGVVRFKSLSSNAESILTSHDWLHRFFYNQAALFSREQKNYTRVPQDFIDATIGFLKPIMANEDIKLSDRFVMLYLLSWTNYGQQRHNMNLARFYNIETFSPFNSPSVAEVVFKTPDSFRKKSRWDKQVWRDVMHPYVSDELYSRQGRSLLVPYTKIFAKDIDVFMDYLAQNKLVSELVDMDKYRVNFSNLPESGLSLIRLVSLAIWYDAHFDFKKIEKVKAAFEEFNFDKKKVPYMAP